MFESALRVLLLSLIVTAAAARAYVPSEKEINKRIKQTAETEANEKAAARNDTRHAKDLGDAIAEPAADSVDVPVDRSLVIPFERRPGNEHDAEVRRRIVNSIWRTPLGQTMYAFLFDEVDPLEMPSRSRQFMRRVFADGSQVSTRLAALQLLADDLYVRNRLTPDVVKRMLLLHGNLYQEDQNTASKMKKSIVFLAILFFVLSLPFGSPIVRQEAGKAWSRPVAFFRRVVRRVKDDQKLEQLAPLRIFSRGVFDKFEITYAVNTFFASFGPASMLFFMYKEWSIAATGQVMHDKIMLLGLDSLLRATEF